MADVLVDEIRCFVSNAIDTLPCEQVIAACSTSFAIADIRQSKLGFFTHCKRLSSDTGIPPGGIKYISRRGDSPVNDIKDIIKLFQELGVEAPRYAALNLSRVPQVLSAPDPSISQLVISIDCLKAELAALKAVVDTQQNTMEAMRKENKERPSYASKAAGKGPGPSQQRPTPPQ